MKTSDDCLVMEPRDYSMMAAHAGVLRAPEGAGRVGAPPLHHFPFALV